MSAPPVWLQFICKACGLVYDEALGDPDSGLPAGTRFADSWLMRQHCEAGDRKSTRLNSSHRI